MRIRALRRCALAAAAPAGICLLLIASPARSQSAPAPQTTPPWAYPLNAPPVPGAPRPPAKADDGSPKHVPNSSVGLTAAQLRDSYSPPDWHPDAHPAQPDIVAHGRKPDVAACGYCHLPNGQGRPENAALAGLPAGYIVQQMLDYRNGLRKSAEPRMGPPANMLKLSKSVTDTDAASAAEYFSHVTFKPWIRVVETDTVPKTAPSGGMMVVVDGGGNEPLGHRIIETPEDPQRTALRDDAASFVAYVPKGSIAKGEALATGGGAGKTIRCGICHGADLKGLGNVPPLAGRSPSYTVRQMYDIQTGVRNGPGAQLMKEATSKLTVDDMVAIAAYTSSRTP